MITKNEISTLNLSPTKKDFVQIWGELLDVAGKLSERWDPTSTNESDPGIVILKALTGIADKLNYNIDKNILEAFMPTAAQEESMRKLCEMMGYSIKYLRSAVADVTIRYSNPEPSVDEEKALDQGLAIPKFTVISSANGDVTYFTTNPIDLYISKTSPEVTITCLEGQVIKCESLNDNNVITLNQLTDDNRFYLPEVQVAENGIFVYSVAKGFENSLVDGRTWEQVDNLNTQARLSYVFKFGYDSYQGRPYIEFPEDISELINDGLFIYYTRTSGINGNVSSRELTKLEFPISAEWDTVADESFIVENLFASVSGDDVESIEQAYNSFKKTIGTFETLVTCRDYMNKIYTMVSQDGRNLVSNVLVTDIRNDINRAITICSCDDSGICYRERPLIVKETSDYYKPVFSNGKWYIGSETGPFIIDSNNVSLFIKNNVSKFDCLSTGIVSSVEGHWVIRQNDTDFITNLDTLESDEQLINHFDLVFYPFKTYNKITSNVRDIEALYEASFKYSETNLDLIKSQLASTKTIAHNITKPKIGDILCINNYLRLNAFIATTSKITVEEGAFIIDKIKIALANAFNMHELDFGEAIPFERILEVIENTDPRIKVASLAEPTLYTTYSVLTGYHRNIPQISEYAVASQWLTDSEAKSLDRLYEHDIENEFTSANFYVEKNENDESYRIYFCEKDHTDEKRYLCASQTDPNRDTDAFISFEKLDETNPNKRFNWYYGTNSNKLKKPAWYTVFSNNKCFFLGAYGENTHISISNSTWLDTTAKAKLEYVAGLYKSSDIPSIASSTKLEPVEPEEGTSYKLFIYQEGLSDKNVKRLLYALPICSDDKKCIYTTAEPSKSTITRNKRFLFNTSEAKQIYNKLVLRNILAGRVPLFNYNNTFVTNFSEEAYKVTSAISSNEIPSKLQTELIPETNQPFKTAKQDDILYTGQLIMPGITQYTKTYCPYDTIITGTTEAPIDQIATSCEIKGKANNIQGMATNEKLLEDVELKAGEVIKFRAPNFITKTTYPAYVNYHLALNKGVNAEARNAIGWSLKEILDADINKTDYTDTNWYKAFEYFKDTKYRKHFTMTLPVSAYKPYEDTSGIEDGFIMLDTNNIIIDVPAQTLDEDLDAAHLFRQSGCFMADVSKLDAKEGLSLTLAWDKNDTEHYAAIINKYPTPPLSLSIQLDGKNSPFVYSVQGLENIKNAINKKLTELKTTLINGVPALPTQCAWTISITFDYIPVDTQSLEAWKVFIKKYCVPGTKTFSLPVKAGDGGDIEFGNIQSEAVNQDNIFYRLYTGHVYSPGKYINDNGAKFLNFDLNSFGLLPLLETLPNIYVLTDLGQDAIPNSIQNNTEYQLAKGEYLYISYTPSSTSEDGTVTEEYVEPIHKVYSEGDIIRPSGFESGLIDSDTLAKQGTSWVKQASFDTNTSSNVVVNLHSLGANEQIEIRDFAEVILSKNTLKDSSIVYVYKNFDCPELEGTTEHYDATSDLYRRVRNYTLKEGEYIFYTDRNKAETAYFTNGTLVTLQGTTIPKSESIDIGTILDSGLKEVPWSMLNLDNNKEIRFTEYQYVTLGNGDILNKAYLMDTDTLTQEWQACTGTISYSSSANKERQIKLAPIYAQNPKTSHGVTTRGNGWEVCCQIELDVAPNHAQLLRGTRNIFTKLQYKKTDSSGFIPKLHEIYPIGTKEGELVLNINPISFKTNLECYAVGDIANKNTLGPTNAKTANTDGFTIKTFTETEPLFVKTQVDSTLPLVDSTLGLDVDDFGIGLNELNDELNTLLKNIPSATDPLSIEFASAVRMKTIPQFERLLTYFQIENLQNEGITQIKRVVKNIHEREQNSKLLTELEKLKTSLNTVKLEFDKEKPQTDLQLFEVEGLIELVDYFIDGFYKLKFSLCYDPAVWNGNPLPDKDYNDVWSRANLDQMKVKSSDALGKEYDDALRLPVLLTTDTYGIASFYINYTANSDESRTWIELPEGCSEGDIVLFNAINKWNLDQSADKQLWITPEDNEGIFYNNKLFLNPGLNCIKINKTCDLFIKTTKASQGEFFFDDLRLVNTKKIDGKVTNGLNLDQLDYKYVSSAEGIKDNQTPETLLTEAQLLADLKKIDINREFYYNAPIEKSLAIEFNETRTYYDTLMNPDIYYDLNNVNNSFVISKLDIDYLDTGIQIARSSRLN